MIGARDRVEKSLLRRLTRGVGSRPARGTGLRAHANVSNLTLLLLIST